MPRLHKVTVTGSATALLHRDAPRMQTARAPLAGTRGPASHYACVRRARSGYVVLLLSGCVLVLGRCILILGGLILPFSRLVLILGGSRRRARVEQVAQVAGGKDLA